MEIKIEKGIPIPHDRYRWGKWTLTLEAMEINDSIVLDTRRLAYEFTASGRRRGFSYKTRKLKDGTVRVWRTE
tara:strand:+ start:1811 stop:2029 length:219 start_codon:yes stop_codon:yes gene_type:complete